MSCTWQQLCPLQFISELSPVYIPQYGVDFVQHAHHQLGAPAPVQLWAPQQSQWPGGARTTPQLKQVYFCILTIGVLHFLPLAIAAA